MEKREEEKAVAKNDAPGGGDAVESIEPAPSHEGLVRESECRRIAAELTRVVAERDEALAAMNAYKDVSAAEIDKLVHEREAIVAQGASVYLKVCGERDQVVAERDELVHMCGEGINLDCSITVASR